MKTIVLDRTDPDIADELAEAEVGEEVTITGNITQMDNKSATIEVTDVECDYEIAPEEGAMGKMGGKDGGGMGSGGMDKMGGMGSGKMKGGMMPKALA